MTAPDSEGVSAPETAGSMRQSAASGAMLVGTSQLIKMIAQFASVIVIARIIGPQQIGISAMVAPLLALALLFQDLGLGQATVQSRTISDAQINGLFWVGIAVSVALALVLTVLSPFIADFYHSPDVMPLTIAIAVLTIVSGAGAQPLALLNRNMRFGTIAKIEIWASLGSLAGSIAVAIVTKSYWAIFASNMLIALISTSLAFVHARWLPSAPDMRGVRSLVRFGAGTSIFNLTNLVSRNIANVLIGRMWGDVPLGIYDRGYKLLLFPLQQAFLPIARVMLPILAKLNHEPERYRSAFMRCQRMTLLLVQPGIVVMLVFAPQLIDTLLGPKWTDTADIFRALGGAGLTVSLNSSITWLYMTQGRAGELAQWGLFNGVTTILATALSVSHGPLVLALVYSATELAKMPIFLFIATRKGPVGPAQALKIVGSMLVTLPVYAGAAWLVQRFVPLPALVAIVLASVLAYMLAIALLLLTPDGRALLRDIRATLDGFAAKLRRRGAKAGAPDFK